MRPKLEILKSKIRLRTWIALGMIVVLAPIAFLLVYNVEATPNPPSVYWALDEGVDNTCSGGVNDACDSSGNGYDAANSGATWQTENMCIAGKCLLFDGTNDVVSLGSTVSNIRSISFWVKVFSTSTTQELIDLNGTDYVTSASGTITVTGFGTDTIYVDGQAGATITANNWHHVEITTTSDFSGSAIKVGQISTNYGNFLIDDVKLYTYARSSGEVKTDAIRGSDQKGAAAVFGATNTSFLNQGLLGYWKLDESSGNANDSSGNSLTLTNNGTTTYAGGKYGNGSEHVPASSQYLSTATTISGVKTISFWVNPDNNTNYYASLTSSAYITSSSGTLSATGFTNPTIYVNGTISSTIVADSWQLVTVTTDTAINANTFYIGRQGSNYFDGTMDEARVYNRALSPAEVKQLYNWAPGPYGYWPLDEGTGTTSYDKSSNGNNGTFTANTGWGTGKFGNGLYLDNAAQTSYLNAGTNTNFNVADGRDFTAMAWVKPTDLSYSGHAIISKCGNETSSWELGISQDSGALYAIFNDGTDQYSLAGSALSVNNWYHIALVYDEDSTTYTDIYINGVKNNTTPTGTLSNVNAISNSDPMSIGGCYTYVQYEGYLDEAKFYNYARTPQQILEDMNAGHPTGGSPIGTATSYWKFDEAAGTTAYDANDTSANNLTLSTASWTASGKYNSAWNGNGTAYLSRADDPDFDVAAADDYSVSLWFKSDNTANPGSTEYLFNKANATTAGYAVYANTSGNLCFAIDDDATWSPDVASCSPGDIYDNTWHHLVAVRNVAADQTQLYIDGLLVDSDTDTTTATLENSLSLYIGDRDGTDNGDEFNGDLDDIKVFRDALSPDEVKLLGNANAVTNFGTGADEKSTTYGGPGGNPPVGYWSFNENTGSTVYDKSGNNVNMTRYGNAAYVPGKVGSSMTFDGNETGDDTHTSVQTDSFDSNTAGTLCMWVKPYDTGDSTHVITSFAEDDNGSHTDFFTVGYDVATNSLFVQIKDNNSNVLLAVPGAVTINSWSHFCITNNSSGNALYLNGQKTSPTYSVGSASTDAWIDNISENTTGFSVGCNDADVSAPASCSGVTAMYEGQVDEVKLWDYALTPGQIAYDYNRGAPVAWYKLDECTGTTIYDAAKTANGVATGNNGTWSGASGTNTSAGTCSSGTGSEAWNNGTTGKLNASLDFDSTDDIVTVAANAAVNNLVKMTITAWIYPDSFGENSLGRIADKNQVLSGGWAFYIDSGGFCGGSNQFAFHHYWSTGTSARGTWCAASNTISTGKWQHIAVTYDDSSTSNDAAFYLNGRLVSSSELDTPSGSVGDDSSIELTLGNRTAANRTFDGRIDDIRIYNYILSESQIKRIMQDGPAGSAARFGPETGSP